MRLQKVLISTLSAFAVATLVSLHALPAAAAAEGSFQRTLTVTGPVHMDLTTGSGDVQVRAGNSNQVQVTGHIRASDWSGRERSTEDKPIGSKPSAGAEWERYSHRPYR